MLVGKQEGGKLSTKGASYSPWEEPGGLYDLCQMSDLQRHLDIAEVGTVAGENPIDNAAAKHMGKEDVDIDVLVDM